MADIIQTTINICKDLETFTDPKRKEMSEKNYPTAMKTMGVKGPDIKIVVKKYSIIIKKEPAELTIKLAIELVNKNIIECQQVAYALIDKNKMALQLLDARNLDKLGKNLDNWVSVDTFSCLLAGVAWREGQVPGETIKHWAVSENFWMRRTALVCTVALNQKSRGGKGDPKRTLEICDMVKYDKNDMVAKALSWAIRELFKAMPEPAINYMNENNDILPARVKREVWHKINTGRKY